VAQGGRDAAQLPEGLSALSGRPGRRWQGGWAFSSVLLFRIWVCGT